MYRKVCIASLFFNPSHASNVAAYGKTFAEIGCEVQFLLHPGYKSFYDFSEIALVSFYDELSSKQLEGFTHALFYNAAISNPFVARKLKRSGCKVMYVYHEPSVKNSLGQQGLYIFSRLAFSRIFSRMMLRRTDLVLLPSKEALRNYQAHDVRYNDRVAEMPLIFDDGYKSLEGTPRTSFSYIGNISHAHAFDEFVAFMKYAFRENLGIKFLIATRHEFPWDETLERHKDSITLRCGRPLTEQEINESYAQSICVWNLYRFSTQSGVMANAFMCGAPVLASQKGAFPQFIRDGYNGKFAELTDHAGIAAAFREIAGSVNRYSVNCRTSFSECFYYRSQLGAIEQFLAMAES